MTLRLRRWWTARTLRWRLIAGLLVLLLATCAAIGIATTLALHSFLIQRLDQQLADAGPRLAFSLEHDNSGGRGGAPTDFDDSLLRGQQLGTFAARLSGGRVTNAAVARESDHQVQLVQVPLGGDEAARLRALPTDGRATSAQLGVLGDYRLTAVHGADGDVLVTGLPLDSVDSTMHRLEGIEVVVFLCALALAGLVGAASVRLSLRPLRRVTHTALDVARTPLASGEVSLPARVPDSDADPATEVGQVGAAVNQMLGHVERSLAERHATEERLRQFIADASHELRTPLAAIRSHAELAGRDEETLPDGVRHALRRVEAEASRMGVLVDDLLLLARLDAGRPLAREAVDLTRVVIDATSDAQAASRGHRWMLELPEEPIVVTGDGHRLHQVLANLLANARTHTPAGTTVTVALHMDVANDLALLQVCDDGPGIPQELQDRVFERFARADAARTRTVGSTGLGLAIVAAVVEAHGGTVRVSSRPGRTCFEVSLPLAPAMQPAR